MRRNAIIHPHFVCLTVEGVQLSSGPSRGPGHVPPPGKWIMETSAHLLDGEELILHLQSARSWGGIVVGMRRLAPGEDKEAATLLARRERDKLPQREFDTLEDLTREAERIRKRLDTGEAAKMERYLAPSVEGYTARGRDRR